MPKYSQFKQEVLQGYPGASLEDCWTMNELEDLVARQWSQDIHIQEDFVKFDRRFVTISTWLKKADIYGSKELNRLYWKALNLEFKDKLASRLDIVLPDHKATDDHETNQIRLAARHILPTYRSRVKGSIKRRESVQLGPISTMEGWGSQMASTMTQVTRDMLASITPCLNQVFAGLRDYSPEFYYRRNPRPGE
ncbi:hypothetical protein K439DRAFT_1617224 [Ramaria rubella]|nr:hypothetical protein K439DRAFT_1617224 [Ramaria rubella]